MKLAVHRLLGKPGIVAATLVVALLASLAVSAAGKVKTAGKDNEQGAAKDHAPSAETGQTPVELVHITIQTVPPRKALVKWGRKTLGVIPAPRPLVLERPRDSGPLDLVIRMTGYLPVHTRAYTFSDSRVLVKLTAPTDKNKLFGYKQDPAAPPDGSPPSDPATATAAPALVPSPPVPQRLSR